MTKSSKRSSSLLASALLAGFSLASGGCPEDPNASIPRETDGGIGGSGVVNPGGPITGTPLATFNGDTEAFAVDGYHDMSQRNLADSMAPADPLPMATFDPDEGSPEKGALRVTAPFSGANQYVDIQHLFGTANLQNWAGKTLHVRLKLTSGTSTGGVQLYVKTTANYVFGGTFTNFMPGAAWQEATLDIDAPVTKNMGYDPQQIISYGLQLNSGDSGANSKPVVFHIDSFSIFPPIGGGGTGGASGGTGGRAGSGGAGGGAGGAGGSGGAGGA